MFAIHITDPRTGKYPDIEEIVKKEDWTGRLDFRYHPMFLLKENGGLILKDAFGHIIDCPHDRFRIELIMFTADGKESYICTY